MESARWSAGIAPFGRLAESFRVLGHPVRLFLLHLLEQSGGELSCADLLRRTGATKAALSQHLGKMAAAGLVRTRREGRYLFVALASPEVGQACSRLCASLREGSRAPDENPT
ncbi:MAG: ArsR family transcriptional regulator [Planctomycetota bacterium]|nr:MAG: ArsR family transcriptional regulator [Planctomycetota bacterium]